MDWVAAIVAIFGSSIMATALGAIIGRFRFNRRAELLTSWKSEAELAEALELEAGVLDPNKSRQVKAVFAHAVRSDLNRRLANELVPSDRLAFTFHSTLGIVVVAASFGVFITGVSGNFGSAPSNIAAIVFSTVMGLMSVAMISIAAFGSTARDSLRTLVAEVLNGNSPKLGKSIQVLEVEGRRTFKVYSGGLFQKIIRNSLTGGLAVNIENFLNNSLLMPCQADSK